ncbi:DM13 domain-containing protein [Lyngbya confervoides]|uniref:DM13 domain-containing protein n=1 Tax=Lyngbya confervoides BDU141951 TaxID=1574623 RepID=A0ABD4T4K3_9CYAN|nr:DM13 domain-containing protein [Lyngbya confervoides]MCM1983366.1 DM13 domain-containing protein [Lyngbya confervoides BDU141951]
MSKGLTASILLLILALSACGSEGGSGPFESSQGDPSPTDLLSPETATVLRAGQFADAERPTSGQVQLAQINEQVHVLLGQDFKTAKGPDLQVVLHRSSDLLAQLDPPTFPLQEADYVVIGPLRGTRGPQKYTVPASVNLADYGSVAIWCRKFNATFGAANLE